MEERTTISGKGAIVVGLFVIIAVVIRFATFTDSQDVVLEKAVRGVLWSTYSGIHLGPEINEIRKGGDYSSVDTLLEKASPDAISIEQISRSEPLLSWSANQKVIVRVHYRFPDDIETQTEYMLFNHGAISAWVYRHDTSAAAYYLNFY